MTGTLVRFQGADFFRQRIILSVLSGKSVRIDNIRPDEDAVGITEYEVSFLKLIEKLTNGTTVEINYTGTSILLRPGIVVCGTVEHDCSGLSRSIGYFLEAIMILAPFGKLPLSLTLTGMTNHPLDPTVDYLRTVTLPQLQYFGVEGASLKINKRGAPPQGGGQVFFTCQPVRALKPVQFTQEGQIKRIRGISYATRVSPQVCNRAIESARSILNQFLSDVYIYSDAFKGADSGLSPGYGMTLVAESTSGVLLAADMTAEPGIAPEDVGLKVAKMLCTQISLGGTIDVMNQWLVLTWMAVSPEDVSKVLFGKLSSNSVQLLRDLREFFGIVFKIKPQSDGRVLMSCLGTGYVNVSKKVS